MKLIELHLLQSFPFTCLNRDDVGAPKTAYFGGVQRARVSSQSWKRAIRERAFELAPDYFAGKRGCWQAEELRKALLALAQDETNEFNVDEAQAQELAIAAMAFLGTEDNKKTKSEEAEEEKEEIKQGKTKVTLYFSPQEIKEVATAISNSYSEYYDLKEQLEKAKGKKKDSINKKIKVLLSKWFDKIKIGSRDAFDISIFGRMVAADHRLTLEGAGMFSHALSTHEATNEIDFFSAVDDTKPTDDAGAAIISPLEANSACYYRYIGLNVDLLFNDEHLGKVDDADKKAALKAFLRAVLEAVPKARKNSMFGYSLPEYALGIARKGQPLSLINAFETPVTAGKDGGYLEKSVAKLETHREKLETTYGLKEQILCDVKLSEDKPLDAWIDALVAAALGE